VPGREATGLLLVGLDERPCALWALCSGAAAGASGEPPPSSASTLTSFSGRFGRSRVSPIGADLLWMARLAWRPCADREWPLAAGGGAGLV
jgi:hypothetical protein